MSCTRDAISQTSEHIKQHFLKYFYTSTDIFFQKIKPEKMKKINKVLKYMRKVVSLKNLVGQRFIELLQTFRLIAVNAKRFVLQSPEVMIIRTFSTDVFECG